MEKDILGKWVQGKDEAYPGLYFIFKEDGVFEAYYDALGVVSGGTYQTQGNQIDMDQTSHTFGLIGKFEGIYEIEGNVLRMALVGAGEQPRPTTLDLAVVYLREDS
jgi:hypothetical protein